MRKRHFLIDWKRFRVGGFWAAVGRWHGLAACGGSAFASWSLHSGDATGGRGRREPQSGSARAAQNLRAPEAGSSKVTETASGAAVPGCPGRTLQRHPRRVPRGSRHHPRMLSSRAVRSRPSNSGREPPAARAWERNRFAIGSRLQCSGPYDQGLMIADVQVTRAIASSATDLPPRPVARHGVGSAPCGSVAAHFQFSLPSPALPTRERAAARMACRSSGLDDQAHVDRRHGRGRDPRGGARW